MSYSPVYRSGSLGVTSCPAGTYLSSNQDCVVGVAPGSPLPPLNLPPPVPATALPAPAPAPVTPASTTPWGLIAACAVSAFVIYKFVL